MAVTAEPALLTFLIADVRGYSRFTTERGDEAAATLASAFLRLTKGVVESAGGSVTGTRGDEALVVFASPRQALRAAVRLQEKFSQEVSDELPLRVGIGIDAGEAVAVEEGYRGAALNLAARLCSLAAAGEVLASETVTNLARKTEGLSYLERGSTELKGFTSKVMVMQVVAESPESGVPRHDETHREQRLPIGGFLGALPANPVVAREAELQRALSELPSVQAGSGKMVLFTGEPGVGKTRLAQEVTLEVRRAGFLVASGRCYEPEGNVPYYPFREALAMLYEVADPAIRQDVPRLWSYLAQLLPLDGPRPSLSGDGGEEQQRIFYAVTGFIQTIAERRPVALLLDDLHWGDPSSLKLLQHLARHSRSTSLLILGTYRDVEVGRHHPLERTLRDLNREGLTEEIAIRRLDQPGTAALTAATFGEGEVSEEFAQLLYRHTEGNPFFTHEVLRALVERGSIYEENGRWERRVIEDIEIPKSVRSTIGERLSHLGEDAQEVLAEASILGPTFAFDDLRAMGDRGERSIEDALDAAMAAGLIREHDRDEYAFNHALTQQVLYDELPPRRRRRLHGAAGTAIESSRLADRRVSDLAWHFLRGDELEKALRYTLEAGRVAEQLFANAEAERQYRTAVELAREVGDRRVEAEAMGNLGAVVGRGGQFDEAVQHLKAADRLFGELKDLEQQRRVIARAAEFTTVKHVDDPEVERRFRELLTDTEPSEGLAVLHIWQARKDFGSGRYRESLEAATRASDIARALGSDYLLADAEVRRGTALAFGGRDSAETAIAVLRNAVVLAEKSGNDDALAIALNNLAFEEWGAGDLKANLENRRRSLEVAQRRGSVMGRVFGNAMVAQALVMLGRVPEAAEPAEEAVRQARAMDSVWHSAYAFLELGRIRMLQGRWDEADRLLEEGAGISQTYNDSQGVALYRELATRHLLLRGRHQQALELYLEVPDDALQPWDEMALVAVCIAAGDLSRAEKILDRATDRGMVLRLEELRLRAALAREREAWEEAERDLAAALDLSQSQGNRPEEAHALQEWGLLLQRQGDLDGAREKLRAALDLYREMGMLAYVEWTEDLSLKLALHLRQPRRPPIPPSEERDRGRDQQRPD